jgi:hypothetical protein
MNTVTKIEISKFSLEESEMSILSFTSMLGLFIIQHQIDAANSFADITNVSLILPT